MPFEKFDSANLGQEQKNILADFAERRRVFDAYLKEKDIPVFTCPGCAYPTLTERGAYEICSVCGWEDDLQDDDRADEIWGGPNSHLSLTENRINIGGALQEIAEKVGGKISTNPKEILSIIADHEREIRKIIKSLPDTADITHVSFKQYKEAGQTFLWQLIEK